MQQQRGTLESIALLLASFLYPLQELLAAGNVRVLLAELGLQFPPALETVPGFTSAAQATAVGAEQLPTLITDLITAINADDAGQILSTSLKLVEQVAKIVESIDQLANALSNAGAATGLPAADVAQFASQLPQKLLDYLIVRNLEMLPGVIEALEFIGAVERTPMNIGSVDPIRPPFTYYALHVDQLVSFLQSPTNQLKNRYGWGNTTFDGILLLQTLNRLLSQAGLPAILDMTVHPPVLDTYFIEIRPKTDVAPKGLSARITDVVRFTRDVPYQRDDFTLEVGLDAELQVGLEIIIQPDDKITVIPPSGEFSGEVFVKFTGGQPSGDPYLIFGQKNGSRLEAKQLVAKIGAGFAWHNDHGDGEFSISAEVKNGKIVITMENADGFLASILSGVHVESEFDFGIGFSTRTGLFFTGSSTLEIQLPFHTSLGPVELNALTISVGLSNSGFPIGLGINIKAMLGPLQAVVEQIGMQAMLSLPPDHRGNLGPVDFSIGFKPPKGVGLSVDADVVKGGGFLYFDTDHSEYVGALELVFADFLNLHAIGLITTKMPDGSSGFSLLIIITADFGVGIELGFGFMLLAVGGLLGLNRAMLLQPLMNSVRTGAINSIMFPQNVVANAQRIISDLRTIFPPQEGIFLIGPMAKLGWGEPTLVSIALGIVIEIPGDIAILGVLKLALPTESAALIVLQVNFSGAIEFAKQRLYFFATLFDSRVLFITIEGEMGVLFAFGDNANFVISVGGFHPRYNPPPLPFPSPRRIEVAIINESYARIRCEGYFAVTSDSVQFGARAEFFFGFDVLSVEGHAGFDALLQFSPFHFSVSISTSFSVKVFGLGLFGIDIDLTLEGPAPWHACGTASLDFFFFSIGIGIDFTWGDSRDTSLPPIAVMPILAGELAKQSNWRAILPTGSHLLVSLRQLDPEESDFVLHPVGTLHISQRAIPLDLTLDKVGNQKPSDANRFALSVASAELTKVRDLQESFAPAQFKNFDDAAKLSLPAYAPQHSGIELAAGANLASGTAITRIVRYNLTVIDTKYRRYLVRFFVLVGSLFLHFLGGASVTRSPLSAYRAAQVQPFAEKVTVRPETFAVALRSNNTVYRAEAASFTSQVAARDYLDRAVVHDLSLAGTLHVLPQFEVAL